MKEENEIISLLGINKESRFFPGEFERLEKLIAGPLWVKRIYIFHIKYISPLLTPTRI